ncbi:MAG: hypothetical protein QM687_02630 [Ferruginibacter sp.]
MKTISLWARQHSAAAITLVVLLNIILITLGLASGTLLEQAGILLSPAIAATAMAVLVVIVLLYPSFNDHYRKRKLLEFAFFITCFIGIAGIGNNLNSTAYSSRSSFAATIDPAKPVKLTATQILASLKYRDKSSLTRTEKRILKKEFKVQLKKYVAAKATGDDEGSKRTGLIILAIVGAVGAGLLLSALVCSISCGGADAAAIIVGVLGLAGIIWGTIALIRHIKRKHPAAKKEADASADATR